MAVIWEDVALISQIFICKSYREGEGFGMQLVLDGESRLASSNLINISKRPARIDTTHPPLCDAGAMSQVRGIAGLAVTKKRLS